MTEHRPAVLFLCVHNAGRSQMAAGWLRHLAGDRVEVFSGGSEPADQVNAWKKQTVLCEHELPGTAKHDPLAYLQNRTVDWLDHQLAARELLELDVADTHLVVEHEFPPARIQDPDRVAPILEGSIEFVRRIDQAAAAMYALQNEVLPAQDIEPQGTGREAYRS